MTKKFEEIELAYLEAFKKMMSESPKVDPEAKRAAVGEYVDGLFEKGSPTVEQFKKLMDEQKFRTMYERFVFFSKA